MKIVPMSPLEVLKRVINCSTLRNLLMYQNNQNLCIKHRITTIKRKQKLVMKYQAENKSMILFLILNISVMIQEDKLFQTIKFSKIKIKRLSKIISSMEVQSQYLFKANIEPKILSSKETNPMKKMNGINIQLISKMLKENLMNWSVR